MAYQKQTFVAGQTLTASHMNHIESGLASLDANKLDKTEANKVKYQTALLFDINFKKSDSISESLFASGYVAENLSEKGYALPIGMDKLLLLDKNIDIDDIKIVINVELTALDCNIVMGSKTINSSSHASVVQFDFVNKLIRVGAKSNGSSIPSSVLKSVAMENVDGLNYQLEVGRKNREVYASVVNRKTGDRSTVLIDEEAINNFVYPAGWMYDQPTIALVSGSTVYVQRWVCTIPTNVNMAILGDSITQGYGVSYSESWAYMCGEHFGNCALMGRSGATITHSLAQVKDILPVLKPKYAMVTIGTNGGNTAAKLAELVEGIKAVGATPIINHIFMNTYTSGDKHPATANALIDSLNELSVNMDIATAVQLDPNKGMDASLFQSDKLHLNKQGNVACYKRVLTDIGFLDIDSVYETTASDGYSITFVTNGYGTQPDTITGATSLPNPLPVLSDDDNVFGGWFTDSGLTVSAVAGAAITSDVVLYAKWTQVTPDSEVWYLDHRKSTLTTNSNISSFAYSQFRDWAPGDAAQAMLYGKKINRIGLYATSTGTCVWYYTDDKTQVGYEIARFEVDASHAGAYNVYEVEDFIMPNSGWIYLSHHPATGSADKSLICNLRFAGTGSAPEQNIDGGFYNRIGGNDVILNENAFLGFSFGYVP